MKKSSEALYQCDYASRRMVVALLSASAIRGPEYFRSKSVLQGKRPCVLKVSSSEQILRELASWYVSFMYIYIYFFSV